MRILYVDMDGTLVDFQSGVRRMPAHVLEQYQDRYDDIPGIFSVMDPVPGAVDGFRRLAKLFDTYVLSTAPWANPSAWSDKLLWVKRHLGDAATKRLILTHHKDLNRGDFLVDDRVARGVADFAGEHLHFGSPRFPDWAAVVKYLEVRAGPARACPRCGTATDHAMRVCPHCGYDPKS